MMKTLLYSSIFLLMGSCSTILQNPIPFDQERMDLSLDYMKNRYQLEQQYPSIVPKIVVVHWTAIPTFEKSWGAFEKSRLPGFRDAIAGASALNVSSQYLIDQKGNINQLMPDTLFARHVIGLNHCAIGIENVGGQNLPLTEKQFKANLKLIKKLIKRHDIEYVIGHHEYKKFIGHPLWLEVDPNYLTNKTDVGDEFMNRLRSKLNGIKGPPE